MNFSSILPGIECKLNLPSPLPPWVGPYWAIFIDSFNQKIVKVTSNPITGLQAFPDCPPEITNDYFVSIEGCPSVAHIDWLEGLVQYREICNCPLAKILARGCQNPNHY